MSHSANKTESTSKKEHNFWNTKPVLKNKELVYKSSEIDNLNNRATYNTTIPTKIPETMEWKLIDRLSITEIECVCDFLNKYYSLENPKIHFTVDLLNWCLGKDGIILSIVNKKSNALAGIICCNFQNTVVFDKTEKFAHIQFLCTHPVYREKNMAKLLINEFSRYIFTNCQVSQGIFESKNKLMQPISTARTYMRPLNYLKLHRTNFLTTTEKNINALHKNFLVTENMDTNYLEMQECHMNDVFKLYNLYMSKFNIYRKYTKQELTDILLNNKIVNSYVVMKDDKVVDFVSFCNVQYDTESEPVNVAHLFLYTLNVEYGESMLEHVLKFMAKKDIDLMITTDTMAINDIILTTKHEEDEYESDTESYNHVFEHKFLKQDKKYINLFNWKCPYVPAERLSFFSI